MQDKIIKKINTKSRIMNDNRYLIGLFDDDHKLLEAIRAVRKNGEHIHDVLTPFPVHGIEDALDMPRSRIPVAGFVFGAAGTATALLGMSWISTADWPSIYGGKPFFALPAFIPITFELTVLFSAIGMVIVFLASCGLYPGADKPLFHERQTDDTFVMAFAIDDIKDEDALRKTLSDNGAFEVKEKTLDD